MNDELSPPLPLPKEGRFVVGPVAGGVRFAHPRLYSVALVPGGFATGAFAGLDYRSNSVSANPCVKGQRDGRDQGTFTCANLLSIALLSIFSKVATLECALQQSHRATFNQ